MHCVRSSAHLRLRTRAHKLVFTPRIVIETNSPAHAESSPHVRRTLDINRESDIHAVAGTLQTPISIHALREENDPGTLRLTKRSKNFNPHSPCGERPCWNIRPNAGSYFNPHSPCGERLRQYATKAGKRYISIHTPLAGSDILVLDFAVRADISIHTPLAGSDLLHAPCPAHRKYFNPHSPCGERRYGKAVEQTVWEFQSTLPLRGATMMTSMYRQFSIFQSTLPLRGATIRLQAP